jgi:hypothetical protein
MSQLLSGLHDQFFSEGKFFAIMHGEFFGGMIVNGFGTARYLFAFFCFEPMNRLHIT